MISWQGEHNPGVQTGSPEWQQRYDLSISETDAGIFCLVVEPTFFKACRKYYRWFSKEPQVELGGGGDALKVETGQYLVEIWTASEFCLCLAHILCMWCPSHIVESFLIFYSSPRLLRSSHLFGAVKVVPSTDVAELVLAHSFLLSRPLKRVLVKINGIFELRL